MAVRGARLRSVLAACAALAIGGGAMGGGTAQAYLFWSPPSLIGAPATGDDPTVVIPLKNATAKDSQANLLWTLRAGLNVAALQCQFAPELRTVENYNNMLRQHAAELQSAYTTLGAYFKKNAGKTWQTALDQYTTRTYNSFSTLNAQLTFCNEAASIGRETRTRPRGELGQVAVTRLRELRNSLVPVGDAAFAFNNGGMAMTDPTDLTPVCFDKKGRVKPCKK